MVAALAACGAQPVPTRPASVPRSGELNPYILDVVRSYPTDGTHGYHWPKEGVWRGNARTLTYAGEPLCAGDPQGRCHCCGLTFEVFLQAWMAWCRATGRPERVRELDRAGVLRVQEQWFGSPADRATLRTALLENGLGSALTDLEQARPGDFVQLWRHDGSGHSVVFLAWERGSDGSLVGLRYWSAQSSTNGIGERSERFGTDGRTLLRGELYLCRVGS